MTGPNFLLIMTDQQRADHVGAYGNGVLRTPNIDGIAERGVRFDNYFVANPSCMPNRATMMTGRMPSAHGVWTNGVPLSMRANTFVHLLRQTGYRTSLVGKSHLQAFTGVAPVAGLGEPRPGLSPPPEGYRDAVIAFLSDGRYDQEIYQNWEENPEFDLTLPYYGFDHVDLLVQHGDTVSGHYARWAEARDPNYRELSGPAKAFPAPGYSAPWAYRTRLPEELSSTAYVEDRTLAWLEGYAAGDRSQPFFLQCSFSDPHHPFSPPGGYWDLYKPEDIELPPSFQATNDPPPHLRALWEERDSGERDRWTHLPQAISAGEAREVIALTYGMIAMIDDAIGRILARLKALGLSEDTVIVFCSDHGDLLADHQVMLKGPLHYQGLVRTPFVWADPEGRRGESRDDLVGSLDFAPTVLERAGIQPFYGVQGRSLLDVLEGGGGGHDGLLIEEDPQRTFMGFDTPARARTLLTPEARVTVFEGVDWGELYDFREDPHEVQNLWFEPESAGLKTRMLEHLARKMTEHADRAPMPTNRG